MTFEDIEKICEKINFDISDEQKIIAITETELKKIENQRGHTCFVYEKLIPEIANKTKFETSLLMKRLENLKKSFIFLREIKRKLLKQKNLTKEIKELSKKLIELQKVFTEGK